jgi:hypothetical protein
MIVCIISFAVARERLKTACDISCYDRVSVLWRTVPVLPGILSTVPVPVTSSGEQLSERAAVLSSIWYLYLVQVLLRLVYAYLWCAVPLVPGDTTKRPYKSE